MPAYFTLAEFEFDRGRWRAIYGSSSLRQVLSFNALRFRSDRYPISTFVETDGQVAAIVAAVRALPVVDLEGGFDVLRRVSWDQLSVLGCPRAAGAGCARALVQAIGLFFFVCPLRLEAWSSSGSDGLSLSGVECGA